MSQSAAQPVTVQLRQRCFAADAGARTILASGRNGADRNHTAAGAAAIDGAATAFHGDLLDIQQLQIGQVARRAAIGVERDAIDQHQHVPPAQGLAVVGDGAARIGHAGYGLAQCGGQVRRALAQLLQLVAIEHRGLPRRADQIAAAAVGNHDRIAQIQRSCVGRCLTVVARYHDQAAIAHLYLQVAAFEQQTQCVIGTENAIDGRGAVASGLLAAVENLDAGLAGQVIQ